MSRICALFVVAGAAASTLAQPTFTRLGFLPSTAPYTNATGCSADGQVVAGGSFSNNGNEGWRWENGVMTGLGMLPGGSTNSEAYDISGDGNVVVGQGWNGSYFEGYRSTPGGLVGLGRLNPTSTRNIQSIAFGASFDGSVIVGYSRNVADTGIVAFKWTLADGMVGLGTLPGDANSIARAVSQDGTVIVGESGSRGFRWDQSTGMMTALPMPADGTGSHRAFGISADNNVIVGVAQTDTGFEAARWVNGVGEILGSLPNDDEEFDALAVAASADGSVVVGSVLANQRYGGFFPRYQAFIWTEEDGLRLIAHELEDVYGLDLTDWIFTDATGISDDGTIVVGTAINPDGILEAWIVDYGRDCAADLSGSSDPNDPAYGVSDGTIDASDFFYYLDQFASGNLAEADLSGSADPNDPGYGVPDGSLDASDFFYYLDLFVAGCP